MISYQEFLSINTVHVTSLYCEKSKFVSYKNISINEALKEITLPGDWFQFGVHRGQTANILQSYILPNRKLHLFDSFEGLPENWAGTNFIKGHFSLEQNEIPIFNPERTVIHHGWFSNTLPTFVENYKTPISFIHMDADLYSSTMTVLEYLNNLIVPKTIILFDELFLPNENGISDDECRALYEWAEKFNRKFQILWRTNWVQCAVKIL
jgi:hypothetical protein